MSRTNLATIERTRNLRIEAQTKAREEAAEVANGIAESVRLEEARGAVIQHPRQGRGEQIKPKRKLDGLGYLLWKDRIGQKQYDAGRRYEQLCYMLESGDVRSCLNVMEASYGAMPHEGQILPPQAKAMARLKLSQAREALNGHAGMVAALDQVCGLGKRPAEIHETDRRAYERLEAQLDCALTILVKHWGL